VPSRRKQTAECHSRFGNVYKVRVSGERREFLPQKKDQIVGEMVKETKRRSQTRLRAFLGGTWLLLFVSFSDWKQPAKRRFSV
jgi:hypothetical protein